MPRELARQVIKWSSASWNGVTALLVTDISCAFKTRERICDTAQSLVGRYFEARDKSTSTCPFHESPVIHQPPMARETGNIQHTPHRVLRAEVYSVYDIVAVKQGSPD
jgi:hypothetical protein